MRLLIFGSCVSRDMLHFDEAKDVELLDYYARCSLVSLFSPPSVDEGVLSRIESKFQRRMVLRDMDKSFLKEIKRLMPDLLLMDFIDERFSLHALPGGELRTCSTEYRHAMKSQSEMKLIGAFSNRKAELWRKAFDEFLIATRLVPIRINKVFWTSRVSGGALNESVSREKIENANEQLSMMYDHAEARLGRECLIEYEEDLLYCDANHKWGVSPFHYNEALYRKTLSAVLGSGL